MDSTANCPIPSFNQSYKQLSGIYIYRYIYKSLRFHADRIQ